MNRIFMARATVVVVAVFLVGPAFLLAPAQIWAQAQSHNKSGAEIFSPSTAVYIELGDPAETIETLVDHPLVEKMEQLDAVKAFLQSQEYNVFRLGLGFIESQIGSDWQTTLSKITDRGMFLGMDPGSEEMVIAFRTSDQAMLKKTAETILSWVLRTADENGDDQPFELSKYRGHAVAEFDNFSISRIDDWFVVSNKTASVEKTVDRLLDRSGKSLAQSRRFKAARKQQGGNRAGSWSYVDVATIRDAGMAEELFSGQTDNPGVELVFGGLLDAFQHADFASASIELNDSALVIRAGLPFDPATSNEARAFFYGPRHTGRAPVGLKPKNLALNVLSYRDIGGWWLSKEDLFEENVIAGLAQADSQLSTVFGGLDFGTDVLGVLKPGVQIVVTERVFEKGYDPDVKVPSFALVARLDEPEDVQRRFRVAFQSLIGFANLGMGQQGLPQLEIETEKSEGATISSATYFMADDMDANLIQYNFSPSIAFHADYFVISSTRQLAQELIELARKQLEPKTIESNTLLAADARVVEKLLRQNRESLIAQNMLENGHGRQEAEGEVDVLFAVLELLGDAKLDFRVEPDQMTFEFQLSFALD